jgi:hypothetical protein
MPCFNLINGKEEKSKKEKKLNKLNCIYSLLGQDISFCLLLKEANLDCPEKCPFFKQGKPETYQGAIEKEFNVDCVYFTRKKHDNEQLENTSEFYCTLYDNSHPLCKMCFFVIYKETSKLFQKQRLSI